MSSAAEGWYVDPSTGTHLRFWSGSTWTNEVAPLPPDAPHANHVDLFAVRPATTAAEDVAAEPKTAKPEHAEPAVAEPEPGAAENPPLDTDLEHTQLTRRELRARRGTDLNLDDAPKHLPPMAPPVAAVMPADEPPVEDELELQSVVDVGAAPPEPTTEQEDDPARRRRRIVRLSVLLGILAVVSSVGVLTAGTL